MKPGAANARILAALAAGYFLIMIDQGLMPVLAPHLPYPAREAVWLTSAYLICAVVPMPLAGRLGDRFGQRRVFVVGMALYAAGLAAAAASLSLGWLVAARAVQGIGSAVFMPQAFGLISRVFPASGRGPAFAAWGVVGSVGSLLGPVLGGVVVESGWRVAFAVQAGFAACVAAAALVWLPRLPTSPARIDASSTALSFIGLGSLVYGIQFLEPAAVGVGAVVLAVFCALQFRRRGDAFVPVRLFADGNFAAGVLGVAAMGFAVASMFIPVMYWLQGAAGVASSRAGLVAVPMSLVAMVLTPLAGRLSERMDPRVLTAAGFGFMLAGLGAAWWVMAVGAKAGWLAGATALLGVGSALFWAPNAATTMRRIPAEAASAASGVYNTVRQLGSVTGVALVGLVLASGPVESSAPAAVVVVAASMIFGLFTVLLLRRDVGAKNG
ncbi:MFS transporter [Corynebacterium liangguodongii]|uniref:MFS transporter n=1 Tax=Corynebacterium liangguodongii TaxID=2079535 RepID=A0A2S0WDL0_9CORY|nr:MFS transporter [Corynebacterium liangguodongii]PWB98978.1 MFS transporter [Corynebacterium liangguodongii]